MISLEKGKGNVLVDKLLSQWALHEKHGGVVPNIAAREHREHITNLIGYALQDSHSIVRQNNSSKSSLIIQSSDDIIDADHIVGEVDIDAIAIASGPGLAPCLKVGLETAKRLAKKWNKPLIPVNHIEAHSLVAQLTDSSISFPYLALVVSGGHSQLYWAKSLGDYEIVSSTIDDAAGEAFDKAFKLADIRSLDYNSIQTILQLEEKSRRNMIHEEYSNYLLSSHQNFHFDRNNENRAKDDFLQFLSQNPSFQEKWEASNVKLIDEIQSIPDVFIEKSPAIEQYTALSQHPSQISLVQALVGDPLSPLQSQHSSISSISDSIALPPPKSDFIYQDTILKLNNETGIHQKMESQVPKKAHGAVVEICAEIYHRLACLILKDGDSFEKLVLDVMNESFSASPFPSSSSHPPSPPSTSSSEKFHSKVSSRSKSRSQQHHTSRTNLLSTNHPLLENLSFQVPLAAVNTSYSYTSFSFSGLKTQVRNHVFARQKLASELLNHFIDSTLDPNDHSSAALSLTLASKKSNEEETKPVFPFEFFDLKAVDVTRILTKSNPNQKHERNGGQTGQTEQKKQGGHVQEEKQNSIFRRELFHLRKLLLNSPQYFEFWSQKIHEMTQETTNNPQFSFSPNLNQPTQVNQSDQPLQSSVLPETFQLENLLAQSSMLSNLFRLALCAQFQDTLLRHVSLVVERSLWHLHKAGHVYTPQIEELDGNSEKRIDSGSIQQSSSLNSIDHQQNLQLVCTSFHHNFFSVFSFFSFPDEFI